QAALCSKRWAPHYCGGHITHQMLATTFDAENRLVADELERRWNQALERVQELQLQLEQHARPQGAVAIPSPKEFQDLAANLEAVWNAASPDMRVKKRIVRTLIREIVVDVDANAGEVIVVIHWKGGVHTE